jgi:hypothetical protein
MRRYGIVSGILLILSIITFALAAPVLVQEKCQACVDVVHIPRDLITVLGERGGEELEKLAEEYLEKKPPVPESSDVQESPSTAPPGSAHASTNVVQAPAGNPASSIADPNPLMEPSRPSSTPSSLTGYDPGLDHGLTGADAPGPQPNPEKRPSKLLPLKKRPLTAGSDGLDFDPNFDWNHWMNVINTSPPRPAKLPKVSSQANEKENQVGHVQQPDPPAGPSTDSAGGHDPEFDWNLWMNLVNHESPPRTGHVIQQPGPPRLAGPPTDLGSAPNQPPVPGLVSAVDVHRLLWHLPPSHPPLTSARLPIVHQVVTPLSSNLNLGLPKYPEYEVLNGPPPSLATPELTDPERQLDHQSSSTSSEPVDLLAAIYAAKGKAPKESRRISVTTRNVGNAELQPDERSLDQGEQ